MNLRPTTLIWMFAFAGAAFGLYMVKYWVQDVKEDVIAIEAELEEEREALHMLQAEWAYLNRPARLSELSQKYLESEPMSGSRVVDLGHVPMRRASMAEVGVERGADLVQPVRHVAPAGPVRPFLMTAGGR